MPPRARVLSDRELNRALLARQLLLRRRRASPLATVERLVAMQAQVPRDPYVALWSRLEDFRPETLSRAIQTRRAVRMTLHRGTLHLVTRADALALYPVVRSAIDRTVYGQRPFRAAFESIDIEVVKTVFATLLEEAPRTRADLASAAAERWPERDVSSLGYALYLLPNAQVTPRGLWRTSGRAAFTTLEHWLGGRVANDPIPSVSKKLVTKPMRS